MQLIDKDYAESLLLTHENNLRAAGKSKEADGVRTAYADISALCKPVRITPRWIPCSERLPEKGVPVFCACRANIRCVMKWDGIDWYENPTHVYMSGFVTHWMPLPEPPEGGADNA